jgi:hypothetical protein
MFVLVNLLISFVLGFVEGMAGGPGIIANIYALAVLIPAIAVYVRRMHDSDHSGWWSLLPIVNLVFACTEGTRGDNRFGPDPKGGGAGTLSNMDVGTKKCPYCAELIKREANVCRYCGREIERTIASTGSPRPNQVNERRREQGRRISSCGLPAVTASTAPCPHCTTLVDISNVKPGKYTCPSCKGHIEIEDSVESLPVCGR